MRPSQIARAALRFVALSLAIPAVARAGDVGDVFDQFFRYTESEHRAFVQDMPGETVDPFSGTLRIVQQDLVLPGRAGLDLRIVRSYSSKIWGRADRLEMEPLLAEKEPSVLGYGWTFHMGRLRNPYASSQSDICSGDFPVYEAPDGSSRVFYPVQANGDVLRSKDYWRMERDCAALGGSGKGACLYSDTGMRYEFSSNYQDSYYGGTVLMWPLSAIVDPFGNRISVSYLPQSGAVSSIIDTYSRNITFSYQDGVDGKRLQTMNANGNIYYFYYTTYTTLAGSRRFLIQVSPPAGPPYLYDYAITATVAQNQYALSSITYPGGGTTTYTYGSTNFFTGREVVPFSVVTHRTVAGRGVTSGDWTYSYSSPGPPPPGANPENYYHVTTIGRPDGKQDTYKIYGFGWVVAQNRTGYTYLVGLTHEISRADGAEVETLWWDPRSRDPLSGVIYSAPVYSGNCGAYYVWDYVVSAPVVALRRVMLDSASYHYTESYDFDSYGQPRTVSETAYLAGLNGVPPVQSRTATWTYFTNPTANAVRGRPLAQHVCVAAECFDNSWTYDPVTFARKSETMSGVRTGFEYDAYGNLFTVTNALNQTLTLSDYVNGTPTSINFNSAFSISRAVSWEGWILSETNGRLFTTSYAYDAIGRIVTITPPGNNNATGYTYAPDDSWVRLARGAYSKDTYLDGLGRVTSTSDSVSVLTSSRYDNMGRAWFKSYPYTGTDEVGEKVDFDGLGRLVQKTKAYRLATNTCDIPGACLETCLYQGNCTTTTVQRGLNDSVVTYRCNTSYGSPDEQRLSQVADAYGLWEYARSAYGKLTSVAAPVGMGKRGYIYDGRQFLTSETSGESGTTTYGRNAIGQMITRTDARAITATYGYNDPLSRLRTITYQNGTPDDVTKDYDAANNVTRVASQNGGTFDYIYDEMNRVTSQTWSYEARNYTTSFQYDAAGCLYAMTYPSGITLNMTCDSANRVTSVSIGATAIVGNISYHPSGQVKEMTYGNGLVTTIVHDDRARVKSATAATAGSSVIDLQYGYDGADNVTSFDNTTVPNSLRTMTYDNADRLANADAPNQWTASYAYDQLGNRIWKWDGLSNINYTYDTQNRLILVAGGGGPFKPMTFAWDPAGRLATSSDGVTYRYDGQGRRVWKADAGHTTLYHYDPAGRIIGETLSDGTALRDFIYLGNKLVAVSGCTEANYWSTCAGLQWYHTDALGSVVARTDEAGVPVSQFDYQPWGERWTPAGIVVGVDGDRQYNGRVYDSGTGFHDYGARMYWPQIGRFVSLDSAGPDLANPMSLNRYSYTFNNPYKYTDPDGHMPFLAVTGLVGVVGGGIYGAISSANSQEGFSWGAVGKWAAIGGVAGLTLGAGTSLALTGTVAASTAEVGTAGAALLGIGGAAAKRAEGPVTTLFHGGELVGGEVQASTFSTTTSLEHAAQYAEQAAGRVYRFDVPTRWLMNMESAGGARRFQDLLKGTSQSAPEWRFYGEAAAKLNDYLIPAATGTP